MALNYLVILINIGIEALPTQNTEQGHWYLVVAGLIVFGIRLLNLTTVATFRPLSHSTGRDVL